MTLTYLCNRLVGGTGERYDRHDMENNRHLVSRSNCLQSRQVFTGKVYLSIYYINIIHFTRDVWSLIYILLYLYYILYYIFVVGDFNAPCRYVLFLYYLLVTYSMANNKTTINNDAYTIDNTNKLLTIMA